MRSFFFFCNWISKSEFDLLASFVLEHDGDYFIVVIAAIITSVRAV